MPFILPHQQNRSRGQPNGCPLLRFESRYDLPYVDYRRRADAKPACGKGMSIKKAAQMSDSDE